MSAIGRMLGRRRRAREEESPAGEPRYVRTNPHDGSKYIDPKEFLEDKEIQRQLKWFEDMHTVNESQQGQSIGSGGKRSGPTQEKTSAGASGPTHNKAGREDSPAF